MPSTMIEKILAAHSGRDAVKPGEIVDLEIDARVARDFGGANVVENLQKAQLAIDDPARTFFTFDCNPGGSDQKYAANQQRCRVFAAETGVKVYDIDTGIGTHVAMEEGLIGPGGTLVSTDSHANIMGAIGAFGQGMGDADIAGAFAHGKAWFKVPPSIKVAFSGTPGPEATPKDLVLAALRAMGAQGLLGCAGEFVGDAIDALDLAGRITLASMATEMGGIIALIAPDQAVLDWCAARSDREWTPHYADADALYLRTVLVDVDGLGPMAARPGRPDDVYPVSDLPPTRVDSVFIGSCTNGRLEDFRAAAEVLKGKRIADGVVLKVVPATDPIWRTMMAEGLMDVFKDAGALVGNAGCAGCAAGQIGQNGPGEITISSGNRNFPGKQGRGEVFLTSPATAAASAIAGVLVTAKQLADGEIPERPARKPVAGASPLTVIEATRPEVLRGRAWVVPVDDIDTDMIFHNRHLAETDVAKMGQYAFGNLPGWEDFPNKAADGDVLFVGGNFGCGSSRAQAVDCFKSLGVTALVARSFGAIYERNAINSALPALAADWLEDEVRDGDDVEVDLATGLVINHTTGAQIEASPLSPVQLAIYRRGGLLRSA